jgi:tetratricopeptide (TPR) repeat protein
MWQIRLFSLIFISLLFVLGAGAEASIPQPVNARFPNIQASLDDGFFVLAEQQARGVLREDPGKADAERAALLLAHALWGQKRYSEMLELLGRFDGSSGFVYWRARAHFELKQYEKALAVLDRAEEGMVGSHYAPSTLRLKGHMLRMLGRLDGASATFRQFSDDFPDHDESSQNKFDLADIHVIQGRVPEAMDIYASLLADTNMLVVQRAQLKLAHVQYTHGAEENFDAARKLLAGVATNQQARLAYRIDAYVDCAALEEKAGRKDEAIAAMRHAIALSPDAHQRVPLKLFLARMLLRENDTTAALKLLEECRTESPNETIAAELQLEKAGALLQAARHDEADEAYQVYLDVANDPKGLSEAYFGKGLALWSLERYAESASMLVKAVKELKDPRKKAEALFKAGDAFYKAGRFEDAEKRYRSFVTDFPDNENVPNALYQLGLSLARIGRRPDALEMIQTLEEDYAHTEFAEKAALLSASIMRASQQYEQALEKYAQINLAYTNSAAAFSLHQSGIILFENLGRFAEAQAIFETVVAEYAQSEYAPQASYMRGFCLARQGQADEAMRTCRNFIEDYPESQWRPEVEFWLAEQHFNQGNYIEAEPLFLHIAADFKSHKLAPRALYWAGRCAAAQSSYVTAIERYSEIAKSHSGSTILSVARFAHGDALTELGEFARAILAFEEVIKNSPEDHLVNAAWGRKGDCQFSLAAENSSRYSEAINSYQAILDRPSSSPELKLQAEYKLGRCLEKTSEVDKAFSRYMNVVYTFLNESIGRSSYNVMWFTRSAFGAAALKEKEHAWREAVQVYGRVIEANVPAQDEALKRIEKIKKDNWLLFQQAEEADHVGTGD